MRLHLLRALLAGAPLLIEAVRLGTSRLAGISLACIAVSAAADPLTTSLGPKPQAAVVRAQVADGRAASVSTLSSNSLFNWAEAAYPALFPSHSENQVFGTYLYRYYPQTNSYLALDGQIFQYLGPASGNQLITVGRSSDFACSVDSTKCGAGPLDGRAWDAPVLVASNFQGGGPTRYGIDDKGRVLLVFVKNDGQRDRLYSSRVTPNVGSAGAIVSPPQAIDIVGGIAKPPAAQFTMAVAPNGDAVVAWLSPENCTASTYSTSGSCFYVYTARYFGESGTWQTAVRGPDTPGSVTDIKINSRGDFVMSMYGWTRVGTNRYEEYNAIGWKSPTQKSIQQKLFTDDDYMVWRAPALDAEGNFLVVGQSIPPGQTAQSNVVVAYRGSTQAGVGPREVLNQAGSQAVLKDSDLGQGGQAVVAWSQGSGAQAIRVIAVAPSPVARFATKEFPILAGLGNNLSKTRTVVTDTGEVFVYEFGPQVFERWAEGVWSSVQKLPAELTSNSEYF